MIKAYIGNEIDEELFEKMLALDHIIFPPEGGDALPAEYFRELYADSKDGLFILAEEETDEVVGYLNCIVLDSIQRDHYLAGGHYGDLKNKGMTVGDNILYIYTIAIASAYRGSGVMKQIGAVFVDWIETCKSNGRLLSEVLAEAVSADGARTLAKGFAMIPLHHVDEIGRGHYYSPDQLQSYCEKIKKKLDGSNFF